LQRQEREGETIAEQGKSSILARIGRVAVKRYRRYKRKFPYYARKLLRQLRFTLPTLLVRGHRAGRTKKIIALTVSTNYSDLLALVAKENAELFDHWVIVTQENDYATRDVLAGYNNMTVLFWDPFVGGRAFDKGSALRLAQEWAYENYPDCWYLIIDSDIALPASFADFRASLGELKRWRVYGAMRFDFPRYSDFRTGGEGVFYRTSDEIVGYFQLYSLPVKTEPSHDASWLDIDFRDLFFRSELLSNFSVAHFGMKTKNWQGRSPRNEFVID
jgi:hypothetical protein